MQFWYRGALRIRHAAVHYVYACTFACLFTRSMYTFNLYSAYTHHYIAASTCVYSAYIINVSAAASFLLCPTTTL